METPGPLFSGQQAAGARRGRVLACRAEGVGIRATARGFEVDAHTGWSGRGAAAEPLRALSASVLGARPLEPRQRDEVDAVLRARKAGESSADEAIKRRARSPSWGWTAMAPTRKLLVVVEVGSRPLAMAPRVVPQVTQGVAAACLPLCVTDGLKEYGTAWLAPVGQWRHPARRQDKGPRPQPRWLPWPAWR